ncbi:MAG: hypothetical protein GEV05_11930 [Betaproteobacteria bacterium]|nr:hypothetical protein [Betaproteobacteria bacterium]
MSGENILREKARELIRTGKLPSRRPDRVWGGAGFAGCPCMLCGVAIKHDEMAVELEFTRNAEADSTNAHLHVRCFLALELELLKSEAAKMPTHPSHAPQSALPRAGAGNPADAPLP